MILCLLTGVREAHRRRTPVPPPSVRGGWYLAVLVLAGYLLFCHGCHSDEDNELFAVLRAPQTAGGGTR
jgi:hypothetical protein